MAVTGRFIRSDIGGGFNSNSTLKAANTFAVDVSGYFMSPKHESISGYEGRVKGGWAVQNLGPNLIIQVTKTQDLIFQLWQG
jgi:hypothetical protein